MTADGGSFFDASWCFHNFLCAQLSAISGQEIFIRRSSQIFADKKGALTFFSISVNQRDQRFQRFFSAKTLPQRERNFYPQITADLRR